jgi:hypothetical protein
MGDLGAAARMTWALDGLLLAAFAGASAALTFQTPVLIVVVAPLPAESQSIGGRNGRRVIDTVEAHCEHRQNGAGSGWSSHSGSGAKAMVLVGVSV